MRVRTVGWTAQRASAQFVLGYLMTPAEFVLLEEIAQQALELPGTTKRLTGQNRFNCLAAFKTGADIHPGTERYNVSVTSRK